MKYTRLKNYCRDIICRQNPDLYIFSYGGCGTRSFFEFVRSRLELNTQPHVHYGRLEDVLPKKRALYLYGDPRDAVLSFFGRQEKDDPTFVNRHLENLDVACRRMKSLEDYVAGGKEVFKLENHFKRHVHNSARKCELLVVRFEDVWDYLDEVLDYVGLLDAIDDFPKKRERRSKQESLEPAIRDGLNRYMAPLLQLQESLPAVCHYPAR